MHLWKILSSKLEALFAVRRSSRQSEMIITTTEERLPRELVSNVLSRLPAKDLLKCKFVCKSWFDLITDPHFITSYYAFYNNLMHSQTQEEEHILVIRTPFEYLSSETYISVLSWNVNDPKKIVSSILLNLPDEYNSKHKCWTEILGPCNGIYILHGTPYVMVNPSLRQFKTLPQFHLTTTTSFTVHYAGFGFDPKTNDYKVVLIIKDLWDETQIGYWTAELYSLNSNSWRKLDAFSLQFEIQAYSQVYTYVNNCCHWFCYVGESHRAEYVVLAFDMVNEFFRKIQVPKIHYSAEESFATLVPFNESSTIGVIVYPIRGSSEKGFDVWVMKDYWGEGTWIKQYTVGPIQVIHKLVGFYGSSRFLWTTASLNRLVLYDPDSDAQTRDLQVYEKRGSIRAARYMESLVSLQRGKEISYQCFSCSLVPDPLLVKGE